MTGEYPKTPTLDRRNAVLDDSHKIGEFLDWLSEQGIVLAAWADHAAWGDDRLVPIGATTDDLLHEYFGIDPDAEEAEKIAILNYLRNRPA